MMPLMGLFSASYNCLVLYARLIPLYIFPAIAGSNYRIFQVIVVRSGVITISGLFQILFYVTGAIASQYSLLTSSMALSLSAKSIGPVTAQIFTRINWVVYVFIAPAASSLVSCRGRPGDPGNSRTASASTFVLRGFNR